MPAPTSQSHTADGFVHPAAYPPRPIHIQPATLATDPRPLVVEHLEDLRGKPSTREELRRLLVLRAANGGATVLTLTAGRDDAEIVKWLDGWADVASLD